MLHKNVEIRAKRENVANEGKESELGGWSKLSNGGMVGREVS